MHYKINSNNFKVKEHIPNCAGIYKIIALDENDLPIKINRFLGTDDSGILYIGKSENLRNRLANMRRAFSINHKSTKHIAVRRYNSLKEILQGGFPIERLVISCELSGKDSTARELEIQNLRFYEKKFGELPPLNRQ